MIKIEISSDGLLKNGAALAIVKGLKSAGFQVECPDWLKLAQWEPISETGQFIEDAATKTKVEVVVKGE